MRRKRAGVLLLLVGVAAVLIYIEARTSRLQASFLSRLAPQLAWRLEPGPTDSVVYPVTGPFDRRRGFTAIPGVRDTLTAQGYRVTAEARFSPRLLRLARQGISPPYDEKTQAGLTILDQAGRPFYSARYPERVYADFDSIPDLIVRTLLYIENRELLDPHRPNMNPAVEWDRLALASLDLLIRVFDRNHALPGGSTLATQTEKFRHSEDGRTASPKDKVRQMISASLRAYRHGANTLPERRRIILDYINSVPLAAVGGWGEVNGLGDGLWAWYDTDVNRVDALLSRPDAPRHERAAAYKKVLSLFIAHRRPTVYLVTSRDLLEKDTDAYLRLLASAGVISPELRDEALAIPLQFRRRVPPPVPDSFVRRKAANAVRTRLLGLTNLTKLYDLDRFDLTVSSTLDRETQGAVTHLLQRLGTRAYVDSIGLSGFRMLERGDPSDVIYSFTLYESTPRGNLLRVQADNLDQPFDINEGVKLDLGSTAKLRTLVTYLEIVTGLHREYAGRTRAELARVTVLRSDPITQWALAYLKEAADTTLAAMLAGAMERRYAGSPGERFFTGGGVHTFVNFDPVENGQVYTVQEGLRHSVNLVYVRLMRDIVRYYRARLPDYTDDLLEDRSDAGRAAFLSRFADKEGKQFLAKFYHKYRGKTPAEALDILARSIRRTPKRLAVIYRSVHPDASRDSLAVFLGRYAPGGVPAPRIVENLYGSYGHDAYDLADRGFLAGIHPLELWLVEYRQQHPAATWSEMVAASTQERQDVYKWLFRTRYAETQNKRIRMMLDEEAFQQVLASWRRQGYPFSSMTPSYASAIGSSGDRPAALAQLMGIIVNGGMRLPAARIDDLHFAAGTPYEITFEREPVAAVRVYPPELAATVRRAVIDVVEQGTAHRVYQAFRLPDGSIVPVGGKTGTGDQRYETFGKGGALIESRVVNRTATFVFLIGDHYFGTLSAHVPGARAAQYGFTSTLPVQILKTLAPAINPLLAKEPDVADGGR